MMIILAFAVLMAVVNAKCPNWCNKRGICTDPQDGGYCYCDWGFSGDDCSQRLCPAGFDPLNLSNITSRRTVRIETGNLGGIMMGKLEFTFGGSSVFLNADATELDSNGCTNSLRGLKSTTDIECIRESFNPESKVGSYLIALKSFPVMPYMNNIVFHNGNPSLNLFDCNIKKVDMEEAIGPYCRVSDVVVDDNPVYAQCSNHGICNPIGGKCECQIGFKGLACEDMSDSHDINSTIHHGPFFTATLHKLNVIRSESEDFNIFQAQVNNKNVTTIRGDRLLEHTGKVKVRGPLAVGYDGSQQQTDEDSVMISTSIPYSNLNNTPLYHFQSFSPSSPSSSSSLSSSSSVFSVSQHGHLTTLGTLSTANHTFTVDETGIVTTTSLHLKDYLDVQGNVHVANALSIGTGFLIGTTGMTVDVTRHTGSLLELKSRSESFNGSLLELHSASYDDSAVLLKSVVRGKSTFEVTAGGKMSLSGLKLHSGGVNILAGGMNISAGGLVVKGGVIIETGGLHLLGSGSSEGGGGQGNVFTAPAFHAELDSHMLDQPLLSAIIPETSEKMSTIKYVGHALSLQGPNASHYNLIHTTIASKTVLSLSGTGHLYLATKASLHDVTIPHRLAVEGELQLKMTYLTPKLVSKEGEFEVVVTAQMTYVTILPISNTAAQVSMSLTIILQSELHDEHTLQGRILIITNTAHITTKGLTAIPSNSTIMLVHNGQTFLDLHTLHAPMEHLTNVQSFTAKQDLNIGNVTFTAGNLQLSRIPKNRLLFTARDGRLSSVEKLTFEKGVLTTPSLKVDKIVSNIDCKGNEISHALLTKSKLVHADINFEKMNFPGHTGIAYFDTQNNLQTSGGLGIDPESGSLILSTLTGDVNGQFHTLSNVDLDGCNISHAQHVQILGSLQLQNSSPNLGQNMGLLGISTDGFVSSIDKNLLTIQNDRKRVEISSAKISSLTSDSIDVDKVSIKSLTAHGGNLLDLNHISTDSLIVHSLLDSKSKNAVSSSSRRLVFVNAQGQLQTSSTVNSEQQEEEAVFIPRLRVKHLLGTDDNSIDLQHQILKNVQLDPLSVIYAGNGVIPSLSANSLYLQTPSSTAMPVGRGQYSLLGHNMQTGQIIPLPNVAMMYDQSSVSTLDLTAVLLTKLNKLSAISLQLPIPPSMSSEEMRIVGIDKDGMITVPSDTLTLSAPKLAITHDLILSSTAKISLLSAATAATAKASDRSEEEPRLLGVDSQGVIIVIDNNNINENNKAEKDKPKDAVFNSLSAQSLTVNGRVTFKETLSIGDAGLSFPNGIDETTKTGETIKSLLLFDENTKMMKKSSLLSFDVKNNQLLLSPSVTIKSHSPTGGSSSSSSAGGKITIIQPHLEGGESSGMTITDAPSINTRELTVSQIAELRSDVIIGGSVTVRGSVVGAGPYIDSSDRRLKTNIKAAFWTSETNSSNSKSVLDIIDQLPHAVEYVLKANESNKQEIKQTPQLGYIAQDLHALLPLAVYPLTTQANADQGVVEGEEPLLGVAYSRLSVVALEGIKALRQEHTQEVKELKARIAKLEEQLAMVLEQLIPQQMSNTGDNKKEKK